MGNEDNNAPLGKNIHERLSLAECELLCTLARGVPVGQAIVSLSGGEDEVATWLARGANEVTDGKVHSLNMRDGDCEEKSRRCKEKIGLWWYNASCEYEDVRKAFLYEFADFKRFCKERGFDLSYFSGAISGSKEEIGRYRFDSPRVIKLRRQYFGFQGVPYDVAEFQQVKWRTSLPKIRDEFLKRRMKCQE